MVKWWKYKYITGMKSMEMSSKAEIDIMI